MRILRRLQIGLFTLTLAVSAYAADGRYRVTIAVLPGDSAETITRTLASMYRARLEPSADEGSTGFVATMSAAAADLLGRDPRVIRVEAVQPLQTAAPWTLSYGYDASGNVKSINSDRYVYDTHSRIKEAPTGDGHTQAYTYDRFGNLLTITTDNNLATQQKIGVQPGTNRASLKTSPYNVFGDYDAAGNMTRYLDMDDFSWDGVGMVTRAKVDGNERVFVYTPSDERIGIISTLFGTEVSSEWTIRSLSSHILRRVTKNGSVWSWERDYIYGVDLLAAETSGPEKTLHFHPDHLGTPRLITGNGGSKFSFHHYYAFGRESSSPAQDTERLKFTGHERDFATLDYMHARYYLPMMGRFLSVDPVISDGVLQTPQGWNRYSYVMNNPLNFIDPTGMAAQQCYRIPATENEPARTVCADETIDVVTRPVLVDRILDWGIENENWIRPTANFSAGFGDTMTFGATYWVREQYGGNQNIDQCSDAYAAGMYTEIAAETALTGGSFALRGAARGISQAAARRGMSSAIPRGVKGVSELHHINPLKAGLFPTAPLPAAVRHSRANLQILSLADHRAAHRLLAQQERALATAFNPAATAARAAVAGDVQSGCP